LSKKWLLSLLFLTSSLKATELTHAIGIGLPYAGLAGYQLSYDNEQHRFRAALGIIGASVGYDYLYSTHWSLGFTYTETIRSVYSANVNYYVDTPNQGMRVSLDIGHMPEENNGDGFFNSDGSKNVVWLSAGYAF
jgi:hypothetical protein